MGALQSQQFYNPLARLMHTIILGNIE